MTRVEQKGAGGRTRVRTEAIPTRFAKSEAFRWKRYTSTSSTQACAGRRRETLTKTAGATRPERRGCQRGW